MAKAHIKQTKDFLESIDFIPIGRKIWILKKILEALAIIRRGGQSPLPKAARGAEFLLELDRKSMAESFNLLKKAYEKEKQKFEDMQSTFKRWHADITKKELESVSVPNGCEIISEAEKEDATLLKSLKNREGTIKSGRQYYFTFKGMKTWINENTNGKIVCKGVIVPAMEIALKLNCFGFVLERAIYIEGKYKEKQVTDVQLLVFADKSGKRRKPPLKHPEVLMLYLLFKYIEREDKSRKMVRINIPKNVFIGRKKTSVIKIYWMIDNIAAELSLKERSATFLRD